ncbi:heterokaryon incompatibility protein-domain-containing protein [Xylariales sp. AK1849]|nr:heterokaryon incompatibility protein-domain-containing protein [Xylariales sp. AK1849]
MDRQPPPQGGEYRYEPLEPNFIRLIHFTKRASTKSTANNELVIQLRSYSLDHLPSYAGLSYAWGDHAARQFVNVEDHGSLEITESLSLALTTLADTFLAEDICLWADAICINQNHAEEKGEQVALMGRIYQSARFVAVWLGPEVEGASELLVMLKKYRTARSGYSMTESFLECPLPPISSQLEHVFPALDYLVVRPWWTRAWIIQESLLAQRLRLFCGELELELDHVGLACHLSHKARRGIMLAPENFLIYWNDFKRFGKSQTHLLDILRWTLRSRCQKPCDRLYGVLSLIAPSEAEGWKPDYSVSDEDVYMKIAEGSFSTSRETHKLSFLGDVGRHVPRAARLDPPLSLPSWVPDWTASCFTPPLCGSQRAQRVWLKPLYNPSADSPLKADISGKIFSIRGRIIDAVVAVADESAKSSILSTRVQRSWMPTETDGIYPTGVTNREAWLHCICAGRRFADMDCFTWTRGSVAENFREAIDREHSRDIGYAEFWTIYSATSDRILYRTRLGYMGIGPWDTQVGDAVCVFFGGPTLYLLRGGSRPSGYDANMPDPYVFVGESYVHGLMDGEAMNRAQFPSADETFHIV